MKQFEPNATVVCVNDKVYSKGAFLKARCKHIKNGEVYYVLRQKDDLIFMSGIPNNIGYCVERFESADKAFDVGL